MHASNSRPPASHGDDVSPVDSVTVSTSLSAMVSCVVEVQTNISTGLSYAPRQTCHPKLGVHIPRNNSDKKLLGVEPQNAMAHNGVMKIRSDEESTDLVFDRFASNNLNFFEYCCHDLE